MKPTQKQKRELTGIELRRTHYTLGKDQFNYLSQYRKDYPEHPLEGGLGPNMDSVTLRKTHFKLGDYPNPYCTSNMEQSKNVLSAGGPSKLSEDVKNDLRRCHFILGNSDPTYKTSAQRDYYDKTDLNKQANIDFHGVERGLRSHNYVLGTDRPDYTSETQAKFIKPVMKPEDVINPHKVSTAALQQSHYVFGTNTDPWVTTQRASFIPKTVDQKLYSKNLTKTNFILGDAEPTLKSVNQETFIKHPSVYNPINKELSNDLRKHHFSFGNDNAPDQMATVHNQTYQDPKLQNEANSIPRLDPTFLRESHWELGNKAQQPTDHYATTYGLSMVPKERIENLPKTNTTQKSGFSITGNGPTTYATESRANFIPLQGFVDPNAKKVISNIMKNNKTSHFELGDMKNDYGTIAHNSYQFDPYQAGNAKRSLDKQLLDNLRATHYQLGYEPQKNQTTYRAEFLPLNNQRVVGKDPQLRKSHFDLNASNNAIQDGRTIYMTDYTKKDLPDD